MMANAFKDDYEMTMLQVDWAVLTRLREGAQHDEVDDACIHSLYGDWKRDGGDQSSDQRR